MRTHTNKTAGQAIKEALAPHAKKSVRDSAGGSLPIHGRASSQQEIVILRRDAERYRWLRDKCIDVDIRAGLAWMSQEFDTLEAAIDAAILHEGNT